MCMCMWEGGAERRETRELQRRRVSFLRTGTTMIYIHTSGNKNYTSPQACGFRFIPWHIFPHASLATASAPQIHSTPAHGNHTEYTRIATGTDEMTIARARHAQNIPRQTLTCSQLFLAKRAINGRFPPHAWLITSWPLELSTHRF